MTASSSPERPTIGIFGAYVEGWRRVLKAPALWTSAVFVILLATAPALWRASGFEPPSVSGDIVHDTPEEQRTQTFSLLAVGPLPVVMQAELDAAGADPLATILTVGIYLFLWGGCLDRLARSRAVGSASFFAACGVYFWRLLRLCVPLGLAYWAIWIWFASLPPAVSMVALALVNIIAGYSAVRMVVEDRRSALGAIVASFRFVRRRAIAVIALYALGIMTLLAILLGMVLLAGWAWSWLPSESIPIAISVALVLHLLGRLALAASQLVYFQHALAHVEYTAAPLPVWPDSPAAEAIENLSRQARAEKPEVSR